MKTKNLSLAEAHASGRRYCPQGSGSAYFRAEHGYRFSYDYVFETKFELEPEAKPLTRDEVRTAILNQYGPSREQTARLICLELFGEEE